MRRLMLPLAIAALAVPFPTGARAQAPAAAQIAPRPAADGRLPVRRVVLYKNGIGFFEHVGQVAGDQTVTLDLTSAQLDDVLKSLTTMDLDGGRVVGVGYTSDAPLGRRLGELRLPLGGQPSAAEFFGAVRGARVEVRSRSGAIAGRILGVERRARALGEGVAEHDELTVVTDAGELRTVTLGPGVPVRLLERDLAQRVDRYLSLVASARDQDARRLSIATAGTGTRRLYVSYISEVPVWKTTYRLVLPKGGGTPLLQGWAIVDNTVGEDWTGVELSLVAGAPQSFIQQISQPYFTRRPVVPMPEGFVLAPQTHEGRLTGGAGTIAGQVLDAAGAVLPGASVRAYADGDIVAAAVTSADGSYRLAGLPAGQYRVEISLTGFAPESAFVEVSGGESANFDARLDVGALSETLTVTSENRAGGAGGTAAGVGGGVVGGRVGGVPAAPPAVSAPRPSFADRRAAFQAAAARELGDLFEYEVRERITIGRNQSALVPIVSGDVTAEKVSIWSEDSGQPPLRAVWLTNATKLTLDGGTFAVLEDDAFAGEGLVETMKPGEKRLISYAADLALRVAGRAEAEDQQVRRVRVARGLVVEQIEACEKRSYTARNEDSTPRTLVVEHPNRPGWSFSGTAQPAETTANAHRFRMTVAPGQEARLVVLETRPVESSVMLRSVTDTQIDFYLRQRNLAPAALDALRQLASARERVAGTGREVRERGAEIDRIEKDQARVRENMKALKGSAEEKALVQRYARQLDAQESRLEALRGEVTDLRARQAQEQSALDALVQGMAFEFALEGAAECG